MTISNNEIKENLKEIFKVYYDYSCKLAKVNEEGRVFTDHNIVHSEMVFEKSSEVIEAIQQYVTNQKYEIADEIIPFSKNINMNVIKAVAYAHDTGMCGLGYALVKNSEGSYIENEDGYYQVKSIDSNNYSEVRINHGLNSAINVLIKRKYLKKLGFSDVDIEEIAVVCMAHFISTSGLRNVNKIGDWSECFKRLESAVLIYNLEHGNSSISFERKLLENANRFSNLATEVFAVRLGDVSRDACQNDVSQSGEKVYIDRKTFNNEGGSIGLEIQNATITIGKDNTPITFQKSIQVHAGEKNIIYNRTFTNQDNYFIHEITVEDGNFVPKCTQQAIHDHLCVINTVPNFKFIVRIIFKANCSNFAKKSYEEFRSECACEFKNVDIVFPWDRINNIFIKIR